MARIDFLLQAVTERFHAEELRKILTKAGCKNVLVSVAYARRDGVGALAAPLKPLAAGAVFFVGIRNGVTSMQALKRLLEIGLRLFAVDTGSRNRIFHPKLFLAEGEKTAALVIGSANLTHPGLHNNIEAGVILDLDLSEAGDKALLVKVRKVLDELPTRFPDHVFEVKDKATIQKLFDEGRLEDEDVVEAPAVSTPIRKGTRDTLKPIKLGWHPPPPRKRTVVRKAKPAPAPKPEPAKPPPSGFALIWESRGLKRRDLSIPLRGNPTGSMLWKRGAAEGIDQRHFFRDDVFEALEWKRDPRKPYEERSTADFDLVIKGIACGKFNLKLSHDTRTETMTYKQGNAMTRVHWGPAHDLVAMPDLLDLTMSLYRKEGSTPEFLIEIGD